MTDNVQGFALSPQQRRLWRLRECTGAGPWRVEIVARVGGPLDRSRLSDALRSVVQRHEILRTRFRTLHGTSVPLQVIEDRGTEEFEEASAATWREALVNDRGRPFDVATEAPLRAFLVPAENAHDIVLTAHSLCADGESMEILLREILQTYEALAGAPRPVEEPLQYADLAEWLRELLDSEDAATAVPDKWLREVSEHLVTDGSDDEPRALEPHATTLPLTAADVQRVVSTAEAAETSPEALVLAAFRLFLARWHGTARIVIGLETRGRKYEELAQALGPLSRVVPSPARLRASSSLEELVKSAEEGLERVHDIQDHFDWQRLEQMRSEAAGDVYLPYVFSWAPRVPRLEIGGLSVRVLHRSALGERFAVALIGRETGGQGFELDLIADPERVDAPDLGRMARSFAALLRDLGQRPLEAPPWAGNLLDEAESHRLLIELNDTQRTRCEAWLPDRFEASADAHPQEPALIGPEDSWSYRRLDEDANRLARHLQARGVGPETVVGLFFERCPEMVLAILGVLKAGAAYLPLETSHPPDRLQFLVEDAAVPMILTLARWREFLPETGAWVLCLDEDSSYGAEGDTQAPARKLHPEQAAYVLYTSGSTGRPKGVTVSHGSLADYLEWCLAAYPLDEGTGSLVHSPLSFDLTVTGLFPPLLCGRAVTLVAEDDPQALARAIVRAPESSLIKLTPAHLSVLANLLPADDFPQGIGALVIGGEALRYEAVEAWRRLAPKTRLINEYGPTETVVGCSTFEVRPGHPQEGPVPIGQAVANARLYVLDPAGAPVPVGVDGELYVGGDGVARGYLGRPSLTAERFLPDAFGGSGGARLYRTGDRVRRRPDGVLEFLGRLDEQVKVHGYRIEPGEIEGRLNEQPGVRESLVLVHRDVQETPVLAAYFLAETGQSPMVTELRSALERSLPEYMIPVAFQRLDAWPLTSRGKVDRQALPGPEDMQRATSGPYQAPRTMVEEILATLWAEVLQVERVSTTDHFFELGGDSILSIEVLTKCRQRGFVVSPQTFFRHPTIRELAPRVQLPGLEDQVPEAVKPFSLLSPRDRLRVPEDAEDAYPAARLQAGMLFHGRLRSETSVYHEILSFELRAPFDSEHLEATLSALVDRHAALRSSFLLTGGEPLLIVHREASLMPSIEDLSDRKSEEQQRTLDEWIEAEKHRGFDESQAPLMRFQVHRWGPERFQVSLSYHHAILDGWSVATLLTELFRHYGALIRGDAAPELARPEIGHADFVAAERRAMGSPEAVDFWDRRLAGAEFVRLPRWSPEEGDGSVRIRRWSVPFEKNVAAGLQALARQERLPLKSLVLAAHLKVLGLIGGTRDVTTGLVTHARPQAEGSEQVAGLFLNTLPFRLRWPADRTWRNLAHSVFQAEIEMLPHQAYPLSEIQRRSGRQALFETVFNFVHFHVYQAAGDVFGMELLDGRSVEETDFPLSVVCMLDAETGAPSLRLEYDERQISEAQVRNLSRLYGRALTSLATEPDQLLDAFQPLSLIEERQILQEWNDTDAPGGDVAMHRVVELQAQARPDAVAIVAGERRVTYRELDRRAHALALQLEDRGVGPDELVGLCLERGVDLVVGLLAVWKAGGVYLPLDPDYPGERLRFMIEDSSAGLVLTQPELVSLLEGVGSEVSLIEELRGLDGAQPEPSSRPDRGVSPETAAYVIYTSGSTGLPKGVTLSHRGLGNLLLAQREALATTEESRVLQFSSTSFDASVFEMAMALGAGAALYLPPPSARMPGTELTGWLREQQITHVTMPPSILATLPSGGLPSLQVVHVAGEACSEALIDDWAPGRRFFNLYGPTETTVWATFQECAPGSGTPPIGWPVPNFRVHVLDEQLRPLPLGAPGEICIGGAGLARGYLERPGLTARAFVPDPHGADGGRLYRSGDLGRRRPEGEIDFLGRLDRQVKVRGFRIEPGEVETVLARYPGVVDAVVVAREGATGGRLLAYLAVPEGQVSLDELRSFLGRSLPSHLVPSVFVPLKELPRTPSGKVDRSALPEPQRAVPRSPSEAPASRLERTLAEIWAEVLEIDEVGRDDNFFDLGGHSLSLLSIQARVEDELGRNVPILDFFEHPTVRGLASHLIRDGKPREVSVVSEASPREATGAVAVLGLAGRFPGARDVSAFWELLRDGREAITFFTKEELAEAGIDPEMLERPDYVRARGVLDDVDRFDAAFFGFTPREAELLDPQQRLFLECSWAALEDAGYGEPSACRRVGVYAGTSMNSYLLNLVSNPELVEAVGWFQIVTSNDKDFLATRTSYELGLEGPGVVVQTACSTSLVAVHLACQALLGGECDMALAGGVSVRTPQKTGYGYVEGGIDSPDGHCRAFDAEARGTVAGSGLGVVVLKRLEDALADGDAIRAVIRGSAINNDGSAKVGYTAPGVEGQTRVLREALERAGVAASTVDYVEAHGTGTPLGDPIEVAALLRAFGRTNDRGPCALGSVKTNIGHLDAAAGIAGLIKTVLALEHETLPPSLHFDEPNPRIDFGEERFRVPVSAEPWPRRETPRRAGVSSFGIGGTNAHVVLEEPPETTAGEPGRPWKLLTLSARTESSLEHARDNLRRHLGEHPDLDLADVEFTLQAGRRTFRHRWSCPVRSIQEALEALRDPHAKPAASASGEPGRRPVAFLFPGQGSVLAGVVAELYAEEPTVRLWVDRCCEHLEPELGLDLRDLLLASRDDETARGRLAETDLAQPALMVVEYALARLFMEWGIEPQALVGHSLGQYTAACLAGVFSLEDALSLVAERGRLMQETAPGAMLAVALPESEARDLLGSHLALAAVNGPESTVVSGPLEAVESLAAELGERGIKHRRLATRRAFHSGLMEPVLERFAARVRRVSLGPPQIPLVSDLTGAWMTDAEATDPDTWVAHLRQPVRFAAAAGTLLEEPERIFLEVGPGRVLANLVRRHPDHELSQVAVSSLPSPEIAGRDGAFVLEALGRLWLTGLPVSWTGVHRHARRRRVSLPTYVFEDRRFWVEPGPGMSAPGKTGRLAFEEWFHVPSWKRSRVRPAATSERRETQRRWLVVLDDRGWGSYVAESLQELGQRVFTAQPGDDFEDEPEAIRKWLDALPETPDEILYLAGLSGEPLDPRIDALLHLLRGWTARKGTTAVTLRLVLDPFDEVIGGETIHPEAAALAGLLRVVPQEYPEVTCQCLDVAAASPEEAAEQILAEVAGPVEEFRTAWRHGRRWLPIFEQVPPAETTGPASLLRDAGVYLITGGLGRVGRAFAEHLAQRRKARLTLVGRQLDAAKRRWVEDLRAQGAEIETVLADVGDPAAMAEALERTEARWGRLDGVIHAAGIVGPNALETLDQTDAAGRRPQFRAKVEGTRVLAELLSERRLDVCVLTASLASELGGLGFGAYAAANRFQDAFAARESRRGGTPWISVDWDGWRPEAGPESLADRMAISSEEGGRALEVVLGQMGSDRVLVSTTSLEERRRRATVLPENRAPAAVPETAATHARPGISTPLVAPRNDTEERLAEIWRGLLGVAEVGVQDDFFELGGHSLLATQLLARVRDAFGVSLPLTEAFSLPTIAAQSDRIEQELARQGAGGDEPPVTPVPRREDLPLSFAQQRLWFFQRLEPDSAVYNVFTSFRLRGDLDRFALAQSLSEIVRRHEILRTTFPEIDGTPVQRIGPAEPLVLPRMDLSALAPHQRVEVAREQLGAAARRPFDLAGGPLLRPVEVTLDARERVLFVGMHHIVCDAWSVGVVNEELPVLYESFATGRPSPLTDLPVQYADFAVWQRERLAGTGLDEQLDYWRRRLADLPRVELPTDRPRPSHSTFAGATHVFTLEPELTRRIGEQAREQGVTLFTFLLAAFDVLLALYTGTDEVVVGTNVTHRDRSELEGLLGFFVNNLVLRTDLSGDPSFLEALGRIRQTVLEAFAHQDVPFEQLVGELGGERDPGRHPLFQILFVLQNASGDGLEMAGVELLPFEVENRTSAFDLLVNLYETEDGLRGAVEYSTDLFEESTIERLMEYYRTVLSHVADDPDRRLATVTLTSQDMEQALVGGFNDDLELV